MAHSSRCSADARPSPEAPTLRPWRAVLEGGAGQQPRWSPTLVIVRQWSNLAPAPSRAAVSHLCMLEWGRRGLPAKGRGPVLAAPLTRTWHPSCLRVWLLLSSPCPNHPGLLGCPWTCVQGPPKEGADQSEGPARRDPCQGTGQEPRAPWTMGCRAVVYKLCELFPAHKLLGSKLFMPRPRSCRMEVLRAPCWCTGELTQGAQALELN